MSRSWCLCVLQAALDPDGYGAAADESFACLLGSVSDHSRYGGQIETEGIDF